MKRSCPGTSTKPISRPEGSVHHANPRSMVRPAALLLLEPVGVDAGEAEDQRRLPVVDVAGRRDDVRAVGRSRRDVGHSSSRSSLSQRVLDRPREVGELVAGARSGGRRATPRSVDAAEDRRAARAQARGQGVRIGRRDRDAPNDGTVWPGSEPPPTADAHGATWAPSSSPSSATASASARCRTASGGLAQHPPDRDLVPAAAACSREHAPRARRPASCPRGPPARSGCGAGGRPGRPARATIPACGPPSSLSPENSDEVRAVARGRPVTEGSSAGTPRRAVEQPGPEVVDEGDVRAACASAARSDALARRR